MRQVIVIGVRRPTLPGSAGAHRGSGAARWLGCAPGLAGPGRSLLRPQVVPASAEQPPTQWICTSGSGKAVVRDSWAVPPHQKRVDQTPPAAGSAAGAVGVALPRRPATRSVVAQPAGIPPHQVSPTGLWSRRLVRCSACPTAVVVPLPGQLPRHGKPGVGLGELQLSAPQVLLDVDVGPAPLSVD